MVTCPSAVWPCPDNCRRCGLLRQKPGGSASSSSSKSHELEQLSSLARAILGDAAFCGGTGVNDLLQRDHPLVIPRPERIGTCAGLDKGRRIAPAARASASMPYRRVPFWRGPARLSKPRPRASSWRGLHSGRRWCLASITSRLSDDQLSHFAASLVVPSAPDMFRLA
jgi:hypothetical protein